MKSSNKIRLANLTTWTMVTTISMIAIFFVGFVVVNTFHLNVFTSQASEFIFSTIGFSSVIVLCSAILNISLNISLIADSKIQELKDNESSVVTKKFLVYLFGIIVIMTSFLFLGDYLSRQSEKEKIVSEANDIISRYKVSIDKMLLALSDTSKIEEVPKILAFLSNQKQEFPAVSVITSDVYNEQLTFLEIKEHDNKKSLTGPFYNNAFYKCQTQDCEYLENTFTKKTNDSHFWTEKDNYKLYFPFESKGKVYILLFTKYVRTGRVGSSR